ncbi:hypothetical protein GCM10010145_43850 [Streptomyces ruber]|uniref:Galactokinase n=2 Tax=Streptomyces TaxID=1883 RepID=A0A918BHD0_9ACTN|nr:galactokinase [Streptomyces ruber]GGQ69310.1 hypothetical protein GCM10010145_43850 [Streptomyces ruber]
MSATGGVRAVVPCRACLSGEDLDWLGGRSVGVALDLTTTVTVPPPAARRPDGAAAPGDWPAAVWAFLRGRLPGLAVTPPAVTVRSDVPAASGLSSSTALIVGLFRAFTDACVPAPGVPAHTLAQWAYEFEFARFHGGGMDQLAVLAGEALLLRGRPVGLPGVLERRVFPRDWCVVVVDSATRKDTRGHIRALRARVAAGDPRPAAYRVRADAASAAVWQALCAHDLPALRAAMSRAHAAMRDLQGMSTPLLEALRERALRSVGLPLKLSGAGGGGALVGVCPAAGRHELARRLRLALRSDFPGARVILTRAATGPAPETAVPEPAGSYSGGAPPRPPER